MYIPQKKNVLHGRLKIESVKVKGKEFPDGSLIVGAPARVIRALSATQITNLYQSAQHYQDNARRFSNQLLKM